tara:strand:- start:3935 stop:4924 length:990 start_codon:yes stop_codon:yes gene_type:complete
MAKNLANFHKGIVAAGQSSGPSEVVCRANIWEMNGGGELGKYWHGPGSHGCEYCRTCGIWCVPNVTMKPNNGGEAVAEGVPNKAKFEIWGAGGFLGGLSNCGIMPPSGSGAYAYKTIDVTAGECYLMKIGYSWCCRAPSGGDNVNRNAQCGWNSGTTGYVTYITGTNLTNFCAESGFGSHANCCNFNSTYFDSDGAKYYTSNSGCALPTYYGADGGANGMMGWFEKKRCAPADKTSSYLMFIPYPGGTVDKCGGHLIFDMARNMHAGNVCCTYADQNCWVNTAYGLGHSNLHGGYNFGMGQVGYHLCGGASVCGGPNYAGRVKITFWRE